MKLPFGLNLARKAFKKDWHRKKVTACYIEGGSIFIASNCNKTDPGAKQLNYRFHFRHAEYNVLKNIENASNGILYVYRQTFEGKLGMARPCAQCMVLLKEKGVRRVVYTTNEGWAKEKLVY